MGEPRTLARISSHDTSSVPFSARSMSGASGASFCSVSFCASFSFSISDIVDSSFDTASAAGGAGAEGSVDGVEGSAEGSARMGTTTIRPS